MPVTRRRGSVKANEIDSSIAEQMEDGGVLVEPQPTAFFQKVSEATSMLDKDIIDITSGNLSAKLIRERFICPGINRECIEFNGMLITPKTFYHIADKSSLKDWKNAIRINGKKIRWYIESGALDFYNHAEMCTGRCKGRTPSIKHSTPIPIALSRSPVVADVAKIKEETYSSLPDHSEEKWKRDIEATAGFKFFDELTEETKEVKPNKDQLNHMMLLNLVPGRNGENDTLPMSESQEPTESFIDDTGAEDDDDKMFWKAIVELGLIDEFFREIKSKLDVLKHNLIKNYVPFEDAKRASVIINELGMRDKLDLRLCAHKQAFDRQRFRLDKEMEALKKKVYEYEHQQDILKRKSDCFEQLINKKPKLEDSSSRRKSNPVCKFQSNSIENLYAASPSNSRTSMCSPGPSASQESLTNVCSPGPSASPESLIEHSQSSLVEQTQSSDES